MGAGTRLPDGTVVREQSDDFGRRPRPQGGGQGDNRRERERLELERQRIAEQIAREQEAKARAEAEFSQRRAQADAAAQTGATGPVIQRGPAIEGPVRNEQGMPASNPFANRGARQRPDQEARRRDLDAAARARQDQMIAFEREMAAAKQAEERMRKDAEAARATRGTEGDARLQEEAKLRQQQEALFEARLRDAEQQYRAQASIPGRRQTSADQRQAEMISEFNRARQQAPGAGRDQAIAEFEQRFQGQEAQPGVGVAPGEGPGNVLSYQELLNRLKQYQGGMA